MVPVMAHPPQGAVLAGQRTQHAERELKGAAGLVRSVSEETMVAGGDAEAFQKRREHEHDHRGGADTDDENQQAGQVENQ